MIRSATSPSGHARLSWSAANQPRPSIAQKLPNVVSSRPTRHLDGVLGDAGERAADDDDEGGDREDREQGPGRGERDVAGADAERQDDDHDLEPFEEHALERHDEGEPVQAERLLVSRRPGRGSLLGKDGGLVVHGLQPGGSEDRLAQPLEAEGEEQAADHQLEQRFGDQPKDRVAADDGHRGKDRQGGERADDRRAPASGQAHREHDRVRLDDLHGRRQERGSDEGQLVRRQAGHPAGASAARAPAASRSLAGDRHDGTVGLAPRNVERRVERWTLGGLTLEDAGREVLQPGRALRDRDFDLRSVRRIEPVARPDTAEPRPDLVEVGLELLCLGRGQVVAEQLELDFADELRAAFLFDLGVLVCPQIRPRSPEVGGLRPGQIGEPELVGRPTEAADAPRDLIEPFDDLGHVRHDHARLLEGQRAEAAQVAPDTDPGARGIRRQPIDEKPPDVACIHRCNVTIVAPRLSRWQSPMVSASLVID